MRIAMFAWESLHSVAVGGVAVHVTELAAALQRRGVAGAFYGNSMRAGHDDLYVIAADVQERRGENLAAADFPDFSIRQRDEALGFDEIIGHAGTGVSQDLHITGLHAHDGQGRNPRVHAGDDGQALRGEAAGRGRCRSTASAVRRQRGSV